MVAWLATAVVVTTAGCAVSTTSSSTRPAPVTLTTSPPTATSASAASASAVDPESGLRWISRASLPPEAIRTLQAINSSGPYPYDRDGVTFENRERLLPDRPLGYYREFTVETPGSADRGARRIIMGSGGELYYTDDHYESFSRIAS